MINNYEYKETNNKEITPEGENWEFWGMKRTPEEEKAVWRRNADEYNDE
ncbi:MAG: hypothetical protein ACQEQF_00350 [Bacillota bacterium]